MFLLFCYQEFRRSISDFPRIRFFVEIARNCNVSAHSSFIFIKNKYILIALELT